MQFPPIISHSTFLWHILICIQWFAQDKEELYLLEHKPSNPQITDVNLGQAHCLPSQTPTLNYFSLEIAKSRKFAIQECIWITEFWPQLSTLLQSKTAQQGKQGRVGVCEGFACNSVKLVSLANGNRYEVDSNTFFLSGKALYPYKILLCMDSYRQSP